MSLNPEPANPSERREHHLPPKSYVDALEEYAPSGNFIDEDSIKETPPRLHMRQGSEPRPLGEVLDEDDARSLHQSPDDASSLYSLPSTPVRVNRKPIAGKSFADAAAEGTSATNGGTYLRYDMHDDAEHYTGAGMDESPRGSIRRPHKRTPSRSTPNGHNKATSDGGHDKTTSNHGYDKTISNHGHDNTAPDNGHNNNTASDNTQNHRASGSTLKEEVSDNAPKDEVSNGAPKKEVPDSAPKKEVSDGAQSKLVYEEAYSGKDGHHLTSVKPHSGFETENRIDKVNSEKPSQELVTKQDLVSGRRAGAGWERSA